jgi:protein CpxP
MKQERFYKFVILLLLLLNGAVIGYLLIDMKQSPGPHGRPDDLIIVRLQLDVQQQQQFFELRDEHHSQMMEITRASAGLHGQLFTLLKKEYPDDQLKDSLLTVIQGVNIKKELITYEHFRKLRAILKPEQIPAFDSLVTEIGMRIMEPHRRH